MKKSVDTLLESLSTDFFASVNLGSKSKIEIFSKIINDINKNREKLLYIVTKEVNLTPTDASKEIDRAIQTFQIAKEEIDSLKPKVTYLEDKIVKERRVPRGPLLAITPFSSPLSSPAHKISIGILVGTPVLFKPSPHAIRSGQALYEIIQAACNERFVYFLSENNESILEKIVADNRIGIISFTGSHAVGKKIIQNGGIKKYQMELTGGNSSIIFTPEYQQYNEKLAGTILDGVVAKNGQRCVSVKHIFLSSKHRGFIESLQNKIQELKNETKNDLRSEQNSSRLGSLINENSAKKTEEKIDEILRIAKDFDPLIEIERYKAYIFPTMYAFSSINKSFLQKILRYEISGPVIFVHYYNSPAEYDSVLASLKGDYINSGLQLSIYVSNKSSLENLSKDLFWGGIIFNDLPTFRNDLISFGGFGKSGLGKESLSETALMYTDPQAIVLPRQLS